MARVFKVSVGLPQDQQNPAGPQRWGTFISVYLKAGIQLNDDSGDAVNPDINPEDTFKVIKLAATKKAVSFVMDPSTKDLGTVSLLTTLHRIKTKQPAFTLIVELIEQDVPLRPLSVLSFQKPKCHSIVQTDSGFWINFTFSALVYNE